MLYNNDFNVEKHSVVSSLGRPAFTSGRFKMYFGAVVKVGALERVNFWNLCL